MSVPVPGSTRQGPSVPRPGVVNNDAALAGGGGEPSSGIASRIGADGKSVHDAHGRVSMVQFVAPLPLEAPRLASNPTSAAPSPKNEESPENPVPIPESPMSGELCPVVAHEMAPHAHASTTKIATLRPFI
jgi:hypothetical protein